MPMIAFGYRALAHVLDAFFLAVGAILAALAFPAIARGGARGIVLASLLAGGAALLGVLRRGRRPSLEAAFPLVALAALPAPAAVAIGLAGPLVRWILPESPTRLEQVGRRAAGLVGAQAAAVLLPLPAEASWVLAGLRLAVLFVFLDAVELFGAPRASRPASGWAAIPLAWGMLVPLAHGEPLAAFVVGLLVVGGERLQLLLERAEAAHAGSARALSARLCELETLHALSREILASPDPARLWRLLERECRKVFEVDRCEVALVDPPPGLQLRSAYVHRRGGRPDLEPHAVEAGPLAWVASEQRGLLLTDAASVPADAPWRRGIDPTIRSLLAVPLLVEGSVRGVLSIQSAAPGAYDEHQLSVLTTIAQQAAGALENARHYQAATVDSLSGLFTRDYFRQRLEQEHARVQRYGGSYAMLMVDLDDFKAINDRAGHLAGDLVLREVGRAIRGELRHGDLACRYGGDEFCLLLPETELTGARAIAERVRGAVAAALVSVDGALLRTTASIGATAFLHALASDTVAVLRAADEALYRAKREGRDRVAA
ncbi:MAG TPA: sensor domain-containing diguanylate cyclase [Candidatus Polarisedimenticolaceae bacterium]|nr:sensor domain-containing diguanylate cyclase [Candidatus Polarisedimenticolaceae bacterium]